MSAACNLAENAIWNMSSADNVSAYVIQSALSFVVVAFPQDSFRMIISKLLNPN